MDRQSKWPERYCFNWQNLWIHPSNTARNITREVSYIFRSYMRQWKVLIQSVFCYQKRSVLKRWEHLKTSPSYSCVRTADSSKLEYDTIKDREHLLYDINFKSDLNCCGALISVGYRDYRNYISRIIASRVKVPDSSMVLDFGSGNGFNTRYLSSQFPKVTIVGVDISESRIKYAERWIGICDTVEFVKMNGAQLAFPDNTFDIVYSCHALEQMESIIYEAISEIVRVMKYRAILVEPVWENASLAQRGYLKKWDYVRSLLHAIQQQPNIRVIENFPLGIQGYFNQSSLIVLEKLK